MTTLATGPRTIRTMCPMNCHPTLCGMLVTVEGGRLLDVRGDPDNPDSRGFLCVRGRASREIVDNPRRLVQPLVRARRGADDWRAVGWDEALDFVAGRMREAGREAVGLWSGHGLFVNNYGTRVGSHLLRRFANLWGCQWWHPSMICWGLGGFGLGLTGVLEANTKEDMAAHARLIVLWGANLASQPNTAPHLLAARRRGARVVAIDVRETEAFAQADETILIRPGTDTALALGMMSVLIGEGLHDAGFIARHTVGFDALAAHVRPLGPEWAAPITGVPADRIAALAREYARTRPAMILMGGSSMHKGANGWHGRSAACRRSRASWACRAGASGRATARPATGRRSRTSPSPSAGRRGPTSRTRCRASSTRWSTAASACCCSSGPTWSRRSPMRDASRPASAAPTSW
jgi:anaerobic selenocysteine-containing dehydrogenase